MIKTRDICIVSYTSCDNWFQHICHHVSCGFFHHSCSRGFKVLRCTIAKDNPIHILRLVIGTAICEGCISSGHFLTASPVFVARVTGITWDSICIYHFWIINPHAAQEFLSLLQTNFFKSPDRRNVTGLLESIDHADIAVVLSIPVIKLRICTREVVRCIRNGYSSGVILLIFNCGSIIWDRFHWRSPISVRFDSLVGTEGYIRWLMTGSQLSNDFSVCHVDDSRSNLQLIIWIIDIFVRVVYIPQTFLSCGIDVGVDIHTSCQDIVACLFFDLLDDFFEVVIHISRIVAWAG